MAPARGGEDTASGVSFQLAIGLDSLSHKASTPQEMRQALERATHEAHVVRRAFYIARERGYSGEDTMTLLAFQALLALNEVHHQLIDFINRTPHAPFVPMETPAEPKDPL